MLPLVCRALVWAAEKLVPVSARDQWREEYSGPLWRWTLEAAATGAGDSRFALLSHTRRAVHAALVSRFSGEQLGSPAFCLSAGASLILLIALFSGGLRSLRHATPALSYRDSKRVVVLAQGPPFFGIRLGFLDQDTELFRTRSHTLEGVATYTWSPTVFQFRTGGYREILAAETGPQFFNVLGVGPSLGTALDGGDSFLAGYEFWKSKLGGDPGALGRRYEIAGRSMHLSGVMPRSFSFLSAPIDVWTAAPAAPPVPQRRWWLNLHGAVARLRPGVSPQAAEKELRRLQVEAHLGRPNFSVRATPIADLVYRPARIYAVDLLVSTSVILLWAGFQVFRDRRRGTAWQMTRRFWGFFVLKTMLPLIALFLFVFEFGGVTELGITGGARPGSGALGVWFFYSGIVMIFIWAWRDQPGRCRVCLRQMRQPLRIGVPGQILLETAGQEVMCPQGHGSVYTSASVLGSDLSNRWMGFS